MTSPQGLQPTLDKRDGSHWDVWDCNDAVSQGEHTVRMWCTNHNEDSNCGKIHLGHGAPGTIVEMPSGCGPGRYAVAKDMTPSQNQKLPDHLIHRCATEAEPVYDLTFHYDFRRVPRDLGDTEIRIDFGNEGNYWETIVDKAAERKKRSLSKRSDKKPRTLRDVGGSHRRWLEEEWRDDLHGGDLSAEDLHKRWFGEDALDWLKAIFHDVTNVPEFQHEYSEEFVLSIIDQELRCPNMDAKLQVYADMEVNANVNYGFTLIARLGCPYCMTYPTRTCTSARATTSPPPSNIGAAVTALFDTGDVLIWRREALMLNRNQIDPKDYVTEHVYETQLLTNFFAWLRDGNIPAGYDNPDAEWIEDVLLGVGTGNRLFVASPWTQDSIWDELALGLGSDVQLGRLALAHGGMNGRKGHLFGGDTISAAHEKNNVMTRRHHRNVAGVSYYMRRTDIWKKFVDTSQYVDNIFDDFDDEYPWDGNNAINRGEPTRPARPGGNKLPPAGLRDLYCYWIDKTLAGIEQKAAAWLPTATATFRAEFGSDDDGKKWLDNILKPGASISATNLRFTHAAVQHSAANPSSPDISRASNYQNLWADDLGPAGPF